MMQKVSGGEVYDDGTYIIIKFAGTEYLRIRKSDKQVISSAGFDTDGGF